MNQKSLCSLKPCNLNKSVFASRESVPLPRSGPLKGKCIGYISHSGLPLVGLRTRPDGHLTPAKSRIHLKIIRCNHSTFFHICVISRSGKSELVRQQSVSRLAKTSAPDLVSGNLMKIHRTSNRQQVSKHTNNDIKDISRNEHHIDKTQYTKHNQQYNTPCKEHNAQHMIRKSRHTAPDRRHITHMHAHAHDAHACTHSHTLTHTHTLAQVRRRTHTHTRHKTRQYKTIQDKTS